MRQSELNKTDSATANHAQEILVSRTLYGETQTDAEAANLRGKVFQSFDGAGVVTSEAYDFKGNLIKSNRRLAGEYKATLDWSATVALEPEVFTTLATLDALNRPVERWSHQTTASFVPRTTKPICLNESKRIYRDR